MMWPYPAAARIVGGSGVGPPRDAIASRERGGRVPNPWPPIDER